MICRENAKKEMMNRNSYNPNNKQLKADKPLDRVFFIADNNPRIFIKNSFSWVIYQPLDFIKFKPVDVSVIDANSIEEETKNNLWLNITKLFHTHLNLYRTFHYKNGHEAYLFQNSGVRVPSLKINLNENYYTSKDVYPTSNYDIIERKVILSYNDLIKANLKLFQEEYNKLVCESRVDNLITTKHLNMFHYIKDVNEEWFDLDDHNDIRLILWQHNIQLNQAIQNNLINKYGEDKLRDIIKDKEISNNKYILNINIFKITDDSSHTDNININCTDKLKISVYYINRDQFYPKMERIILDTLRISKTTLKNVKEICRMDEEDMDVDIYVDFSKCSDTFNTLKHTEHIEMKAIQTKKRELDMLPYFCAHKILIQPNNILNYIIEEELTKGQTFFFKKNHNLGVIEDIDALNYIQSIKENDPFYLSHMIKMHSGMFYIFCLRANDGTIDTSAYDYKAKVEHDERKETLYNYLNAKTKKTEYGFDKNVLDGHVDMFY